ncbi:TPA: DUF3265 domain-containing protein, partial [Vibrio vulnificus]|nr:DUF3265 domain-containing protein [Vibrio vulnificus]
MLGEQNVCWKWILSTLRGRSLRNHSLTLVLLEVLVTEVFQANKAFKWDSCRVAFLVCGDFCGESGLRKVGLGGIHPLT